MSDVALITSEDLAFLYSPEESNSGGTISSRTPAFPIISLLFMIFVIYVYVRTFFQIRRHSDVDTATAVDHQISAGLEPKVIAALQTFPYAKKSSSCVDGGEGEGEDEREGSGTVCAVCLNEMEEGEVVRLMPRCKHVFHAGCIDKWLVSHSTCPLCRTVVEPPRAPLVAESPAVQHAITIDIPPEEGEASTSAVDVVESPTVIIIHIQC